MLLPLIGYENCLLSSQIAEFFDQQYLSEIIWYAIFYAWSYSSRKGSIWDNHVWMERARILWLAISQERTHRYICYFCLENHQGKVASKITSYGWQWPGVPLVQPDSRILWLSISLEGINRYLSLTTYLLASFIKLSGLPFSYDLFLLS